MQKSSKKMMSDLVQHRDELKRHVRMEDELRESRCQAHRIKGETNRNAGMRSFSFYQKKYLVVLY